MIVVDASAAVLALLNDGDARRHLGEESLAAPHLVDSEVVHALRSQTRRGAIDDRSAQRCLERWSRLGLRRYRIAPLIPRMWELRENLSAYDATYVALAEAMDSGLLTADAKLSSAPGVRCPVVVVRR